VSENVLVLRRQIGESLVVGAEILITLTRVHENTAEVTLTNLRTAQCPVLTLDLGVREEFRPGMKLLFLDVLDGGAGARLGLELPSDVPVLRKELWDERNRSS
jgi:sRNA-binding carbon storage regulator CsrA